MDVFGSEDPPSCPTVLITVSARHGPDTVVEITNSATDNAAKTKMEKSVLLMRALIPLSIHSPTYYKN